MNIFLKIFIIFVLSTINYSCSIKKVDNVHGVINLAKKAKDLNKGINNKNDVRKVLGPPPLRDPNDLNIWIYIEVRDTKNLLGSKKINVNDTFIIKFDSKGIIEEKIFLDKKQMQDIAFSDKETISKGIDSSLIKNVLSSTRKRLENASNRNK